MAPAEIMPLGGMGQCTGGLARGQTENASARRWRQVLGKNAIRMGCGNGGIEDGAQQGASVGHHVIA